MFANFVFPADKFKEITSRSVAPVFGYICLDPLKRSLCRLYGLQIRESSLRNVRRVSAFLFAVIVVLASLTNTEEFFERDVNIVYLSTEFRYSRK